MTATLGPVETFDLAGARRAADEGRLYAWLDALLRREPGANRSLAAILRGHRPRLEGPVLLPLDGLTQSAGPGPGFKWPADPERWEADIAALAALDPEALPPMVVRDTAGARHLSDGNHRLDAWRRRGEAHGWAVVWRDRDPRFEGHWSPFLPERTPRIEAVGAERVRELLPKSVGTTLAALVGDRVVGAACLAPIPEGSMLGLAVHEEWRGLRLGARLLHHMRPQLEKGIVLCRADHRLTRFHAEFGFFATEGDGALLRRVPEPL